MVIDDLDIFGIACRPSETNPPLIIDPNAHLSLAFAPQEFEPVAGWVTQIIDRYGGIQLAQLAQRPVLDFSWKLPARLTSPHPRSFLGAK